MAQKNPEMPEEVLKKCVLPLKVLAQQRILVQRSKFHDFDFLRSVASKRSTPEFGGFNIKLTQMQGQGLKPRTKAMYTPLIDLTPSDPTTMKSAMLEAKRRTQRNLVKLQLYLLQIFNSIMWVSMYSWLTQNFLVRTSSFVLGDCTF